ncbi:MAG: carbohydrate kinase [Lachnospiraceae bacterium]|nr:carbohydrate kinase [Lachnospiraceae bacterium]
MKQYDVTALGELLIDFTQNGFSAQGNPMYEANPGGAPCNVLAMLKKLGDSAAFIGKVGQDGFGRQLCDSLKEVGIATDGLCFDEEVHTTLALVHTDASGDRDFSFYRKPGADVRLTEADLKEELIQNCRIFHFGSLSLTDEPVRSATKKALALAKEAGAWISFDPNLRKPLWDSLDAAKEQIRFGMSQCQILKISDDEILWFTGETEYDAAVKKLQEEFQIPLIFVTLGREGSMAYCGDTFALAKPFLQENTVETTGAGDTFMGSVLHFILKKGYENLSREDLQEMLQFANGAASLITTKKGALRVMPEEEEVRKLIAERTE